MELPIDQVLRQRIFRRHSQETVVRCDPNVDTNSLYLQGN